MDSRTKSAIIYDGLERFILTHTLSGRLPIYVVAEYPKSGGTWFGQMLSSALELPFPRNQRMGRRSCVAHGHYLYSRQLKNACCVWRDGRDIMVSYYFHSLFQNDRNSAHLVNSTRHRLQFDDYEDVTTNLPRFIEYLFERQKRSFSPFRFTWTQFVRSWADRDVVHVKYEDLIADTVPNMQAAVAELTGRSIDRDRMKQIAHEYSFRTQTGRTPGDEDTRSFIRKGVPGDWRSKFSLEARQVFDHYAGESLIRLGYESDRGWVSQCATSGAF